MTEKPQGRQFSADALSTDPEPAPTLAQQAAEETQRRVEEARTKGLPKVGATVSPSDPAVRAAYEGTGRTEAPDEDTHLSEAQLAYQAAVLDTQVSPEVVKATYEAHLVSWDEQLAYQKKLANDSGKWGKYMKLRAMRAHIPAKVTQLLALLKYPELFTEYWIQIDSDQGARVWAYVYAKPEDFRWATVPGKDPGQPELLRDQNGQLIPGGKYLARDCKQVKAGANRPRGEDGDGGGSDYLEKAITGARQRALKQLGLGTAAGIAALEDVQNQPEDDGKGLTPPAATPPAPVAPPAPEPPQAPEQEDDMPRERVHQGGTIAEEAERFRQWQKQQEDKVQAARERFLEYLGTRAKVMAREEVEAVYGPVADMTVADMKRVHTELEQIRSKAKWAEHLGKQTAPDLWKRWREWPGGDEHEQALGYLQAVQDALPDDATQLRQLVLDSMAAVRSVSDDLALMPATQQIDALVQGILPALGEAVDLEEVQP